MDKPKIVVIDGDPKNLQILRESLESANFQVTTTENGQEAWTAIQSLRPDIVVSEVDVPGLDGFQLLEKLQNDPLGVTTPMVFLTNRRNLQDRIKSLRTGVKDYMIKPLHVKEVIARLQMILRRIETFTKEDSSESRRKIVGRLEEHDVEKLVESYGLERRTGVLSIYDQDNRNGEIYFRDGCVVNARFANFRAEKAVYQMLPWDRGHYIMTFKEVTIDDEITVSNLGLLLQGFKRLQERENMLLKLPPLDTTLVKTVIFDQILGRKAIGPDALRFIALFDGQRSLSDILSASTYDDLKTLERITRLYDQGFIRPVSDAPDNVPPIAVDDDPAIEESVNPPPLSAVAEELDDSGPGENPDLEQQIVDSVSQNSGSPDLHNGHDVSVPETGFSTYREVEKFSDEGSAEKGAQSEEPYQPLENESLPPHDHDDDSPDVEMEPSAPAPDRAPDLAEEALEEAPAAEITPDGESDILFDITEREELLEQPFDLDTKEEQPSLFMSDFRDIEKEAPKEETQRQEETEPEPFLAEHQSENVFPDHNIEPPVETNSADERIERIDEVPKHDKSDISIPPQTEPGEELRPEPQIEPHPKESEVTPQHRPHEIFANNGNGASTQPSVPTADGFHELADQLFGTRTLAKGHLAIIGAHNAGRDALVKTLSQPNFSKRCLGPSQDDIEIGRLQTSREHMLEIIGLATEKRFLQILEQISGTLLGYVVLVASDHSSSLSYLGYLLNSLKSTLTVPHLIAVYQPENQRRIPIDFVRYSLNLQNEEQIVEVKPTDPDSVRYLLKQLQKPGNSRHHRSENEIRENS